eukprot:4372109-Prymnesium_polylepis.1
MNLRAKTSSTEQRKVFFGQGKDASDRDIGAPGSIQVNHYMTLSPCHSHEHTQDPHAQIELSRILSLKRSPQRPATPTSRTATKRSQRVAIKAATKEVLAPKSSTVVQLDVRKVRLSVGNARDEW